MNVEPSSNSHRVLPRHVIMNAYETSDCDPHTGRCLTGRGMEAAIRWQVARRLVARGARSFCRRGRHAQNGGGMGLLWYTRQPFANTTIRVVFKTASPNANFGVYIRFPEKPKDPWYAVHNGYEVQIDAATSGTAPGRSTR